ncbi:MAG: F0F1 ATP synthase subunit A [Luteibaculaceae bacterium]
MNPKIYLNVALACLFTTSISLANNNLQEINADSLQVESILVESQTNVEATEKRFDPVPMIMHHIGDAHDFHIIGEGENAVSLPLPVILWTDKGLITFMSSAFHHDDEGKVVVEKNGLRLVKYHEKIYIASDEPNYKGTYINYNENKEIANVRPTSFSITKNVFSMLMSAVLLLVIFGSVGSAYKKTGKTSAPKGLQSVIEPLVLFVRDEIAIPNIGKEKYKSYLPLLLTMFFFIWLNNLIGLIPVFPGSANLSGNISFTLALAAVTLVVVNVAGTMNAKNYWGHMLWMPGVPIPVRILLAPIELVGVITKPFALMIRLFANITAGHIIILSFISLIFIFKSVAIAPVSVAFALFINVLELLVAALQAFIFTLLTALFIGAAVQHHDHH